MALRSVQPWFWAMLQTYSAGAYGWTEVFPDGKGAWILLTNGRSGTTKAGQAYEANGVQVSLGTIVVLYPGFSGEFLFFDPGGVQGNPASSLNSSGSTSQGICTPIVTNVQCINGMLQVSYKYLTLPAGATLSDTPC